MTSGGMERGTSVSPAVHPHRVETALSLSLRLLYLELGVKTPAVRGGRVDFVQF